MVAHEIIVNGVDLRGTVHPSPVLLQMNQEDFPQRFLGDLAAAPVPKLQLSSTKKLAGTFQQPALLFQPVQRILHIAMMQLACDSVMQPPLDPLRVVKAGLVIRRLRRSYGGDHKTSPYQAWMKTSDGKFSWQALSEDMLDADPDPQNRPQLQSGQAHLDSRLAAIISPKPMTEVYTPAFLAPPAANAALCRTVAYGVVPTASSELSDAALPVPNYDSSTLVDTLPTLLKNNSSAPSAPASGSVVDYRWLSDAYASARGVTNFSTFSSALIMLNGEFGAFEDTDEGHAILKVLAGRNVTFTVTNADGTASTQTQNMQDFYTQAKQTLIDYDPNSGQTLATLTMPTAWEAFSKQDQDALISSISAALQKRSVSMTPPEGRFQDPSRLYVLRMFFRVKGHTPSCPAELYWSKPSDVFRIAAWYDSTQRTPAPIPLPDPTLRSFLQGAKPNVSFVVPKNLMNAMQGTTLKGLMAGDTGGSNFKLNWICGFNIPLITICAFFVLNIFLMLLNIVFFWLPFIKICIPFPLTMPPSGDD